MILLAVLDFINFVKLVVVMIVDIRNIRMIILIENLKIIEKILKENIIVFNDILEPFIINNVVPITKVKKSVKKVRYSLNR